MRIRRGLSSRRLSCGCVAGIYETYRGEIVTIIDARGDACDNTAHADGKAIPTPGSPASNAPGAGPRG